jgi:tetratricopeptide (TPR) repeat protein
VHTATQTINAGRPAPLPATPLWRTLNERGLTLAAHERWADALAAFTDALHHAPSFADAPDVHALLHANRAQAHCHCGELHSAVESAHRALAARLVCCEANDAPVARMHADLGVYLAVCGRHEEAEQSLHSALAALAARGSEYDAHLNTVHEHLIALRQRAEPTQEPHREERTYPSPLGFVVEYGVPLDLLFDEDAA